MVTYSSYSALGTSIENNEISDGVITVAKLSESSFGDVWVLIETLEPSAATTITSGTLDAYDQYLIDVDVSTTEAVTQNFHMRINGDTGTNYTYQDAVDGSFAETTGGSSMVISKSFYASARGIVGSLLMNGKAGPSGNPQVAVINNNLTGESRKTFISGKVVSMSNNEQVSELNFFSSNAFTGKIKIYGRSVQ
jgi:hypothetical protein